MSCTAKPRATSLAPCPQIHHENCTNSYHNFNLSIMLFSYDFFIPLAHLRPHKLLLQFTLVFLAREFRVTVYPMKVNFSASSPGIMRINN